ncbi:efflux RND transporter periplasmic adaptor subunit [Leptospira sp. 2 VSF19]|uniref:Efflux RND transporter periplasmic adaptor subunit n=1 Tax=Leptospira soteropolitanensis TaxID=2950025 RepID=A0AAW5VEC4_9LEPT|nr:efflux RND transporter periplasmic adaptor subunit [Leptospira soteropolitanensis]MCW7492944.1 efflux RND transporter periplasmic adaptor subunit [Leptospira soteropolitanensis]MCW7500179.1 efflux RND transporter periplasmic adaptor subunit [Leptospira soteropolitanensis]MCW7522430.1 efflux RND transporter periplasmic adaptor subunit [Leptospira soteropolitanensis]MCW7526286.1 efflux RND transporter periplasmic adaptor subunit [Leptospira soteropolitanensis]MCW7529602.1 efflux RND transport
MKTEFNFKNIRSLSILVLVGSLGYFGYTKFFGSGKKTEALTEDKSKFIISQEIQKNHPFSVVYLEEKALEEELQLPGTVSYDMNSVAKVGSRVSGRIVQVFVKEGEYVKKSTALASIQSVELGTTEANYLKARARLEALKVQADRAKDLYERKVTSAKEYEMSLMDYKSVKAEMETSRNALENLGLNEVEIANLEAGKYNSKNLYIRTPISGTVTEREAIIGQAVNARDNLFTVADLSVLWINLEVYEKDLASIRMGNEAKVIPIGSKDDSLKAVVSHVGDVIDPIKKTAEIRLEVRNSKGRLRPGQSVTATVVGAMVESSVNKAKVIPVNCIHKIEGENFVFVRNGDGSFSAKKIGVGKVYDNWVEVVTGVESGEAIVEEGSFVLKSEYLKL